MQRNYTPQGKPQDPSALDRQAHAVALAELKAFAPSLSAQMRHVTELNKLVTEAILLGGHTTAELNNLIRQTRAVLGLHPLR